MIESFLKYLEYEKRYSNHTLQAYQNDLTQLFLFLQDSFDIKDVSEIMHIHLRSWIVNLVDNNITANSVNRKIATLKSYFKYLQAREYIKKNPTTRLKPLKTKKRLPSFVRESEMVELLDNFSYSNDYIGSRDKLVIEVLYNTGIRLNELINLKDSSVNVYDNSIKVLGKRNKERIIPITGSLVNAIKKYLELRHKETLNTDYLILTDKFGKLYPMFVYRLIKKYLTQITSLSKKSPHVLRHTFATHLLNKGADINAVKDLLGHASLAATQVYTHNSLEKLKSTFDKAHPKA